MAINVLIVDDSQIMRRMIKKTLELSGLPLGEIWEAGNGQEGLAALEKNWVDIILLDINMPIMNGEKMLEALRADAANGDVKVVVISTESSPKRLDRIKPLVSGFIHKPFTPESVGNAVAALMGVTRS